VSQLTLFPSLPGRYFVRLSPQRCGRYLRALGNLTGFTAFEAEVGGKWLDILKEIAPRVSRAAVLFYPETPAYVAVWHWVEAAATPFAIKVSPAGVRDASEIERAIAAFAEQADGGLIVVPTPVTVNHARNRRPPSIWAALHLLPSSYPRTGLYGRGIF
jgi:putative ABC transport system substrate-binding protein